MPSDLGAMPSVGVILANCDICQATQPVVGEPKASTAVGRGGNVSLERAAAVELVFRAPTAADDPLTLSVDSGSSALTVEASSSAAVVDLGERQCRVAGLQSGAWHHLLCGRDGNRVDCALDGVSACAEESGGGALGDGGAFEVDPGSGAFAVARVFGGAAGALPSPLSTTARQRLLSYLGISGDLVPASLGQRAVVLPLSTPHLVSPRWPRVLSRGPSNTPSLFLEGGRTSVAGALSCPSDISASAQGLTTCRLNRDAQAVVGASEGRFMILVTSPLGAPSTAIVAGESRTSGFISEFQLSQNPHGFLVGTVPENDALTSHEVVVTATANVVVALPAIVPDDRGTPPVGAGTARAADSLAIDVPAGTARIGIDDGVVAGDAAVADIFVGADTLRLSIRADGVAELRDLATGEVRTQRLPQGALGRVELGVTLPRCGDDCAPFVLPRAPTGLRLTDGRSSGFDAGGVVNRVDFFDR